MGYYTSHALNIYDITTATPESLTGKELPQSGELWEEIVGVITTLLDMCAQEPFSIDELMWDGGECRWGTQDADMKALSVAFPTVLFEVECVGEDGENWCDRYLNGRQQHVHSVFPPFDPEELV